MSSTAQLMRAVIPHTNTCLAKDSSASPAPGPDRFRTGESTGVQCPKCKRYEIVYDGSHYACRFVLCGWTLTDRSKRCNGCDELHNVCYLGVLAGRNGRIPRNYWRSLLNAREAERDQVLLRVVS